MTENPKKSKSRNESPLDIQVGGIPLSLSDAELLQDAQYVDLMVKYQNAEWADCLQILEVLQNKYPDNPRLGDFKVDIETQLTLQRMEAQDAISRKKNKTRALLRNSIFFLLLFLVIFAFFTRGLINYQAQLRQQAFEAQQLQTLGLKALEDQAKALILAGKPDMALSILDTIAEADPEYPNLELMRADATHMIVVGEKYDNAVLAMDQGLDTDALTLFNQINQEVPLYRDVESRIKTLNDRLLVRKLLEEGDVAFLNEEWSVVIDKYEQAMEMDPQSANERTKQQLLSSYLHMVILSLNKDQATVEEIELAERYYHKALALIPQSRAYASERENLQNLSIQLISAKYLQTAKLILANPNNGERMVTTAVEYLNRALALTPRDAEINSEIGKAQIYLAALKNFSSGNWEEAIKQLEALSMFDPSYPNGMGLQLLYEAYLARGQKYYRGGFYLDARKNFEAAEVLAFDQPDNKIRLFAVQIEIGKAIGKLDDYQNASSYFNYAFLTINATSLASKSPEFVEALQKADDLFTKGKYPESYNAYIDLLPSIPVLYSYETVTVSGGESLAYLASRYHSTMTAIREENHLGDSNNIQYNAVLTIPFIP